MAATSLYNAALAPHANTGPLVLAITQPAEGVTVTIKTTPTNAQNEGVSFAYALSIDGGATYESQVSIGEQLGAVAAEDEFNVEVGSADHIAIYVQNDDSALAVSNLTVLAEQYA